MVGKVYRQVGSILIFRYENSHSYVLARIECESDFFPLQFTYFILFHQLRIYAASVFLHSWIFYVDGEFLYSQWGLNIGDINIDSNLSLCYIFKPMMDTTFFKGQVSKATFVSLILLFLETFFKKS